MLGKILNLAVLAALAWVGWYGYTHWIAASSDASGTEQAPAFNCRQALARHAEDQACKSSNGCSMTSDELADANKLESDIQKYCN